MTEGKGISIWFFIGALLAFYGLLIAGQGLYSLVNPPAHRTVLHELHPSLWWGAILLLLGGAYCWRFFPRKGN